MDALGTGPGAPDGRVGRDPPDQARLGQLAEEQAALRRVATLVARATPPEQVFAVVAEEVGRLLAVDFAILVRYDPQDTLEIVGTWTRTGAPPATPVGGRLPLGGRNVTTVVYRSSRPARIDYSDVSGVIGRVASRDWGLRSSVGVPVSAEGRVWGCIVVAFSGQELLPAGTEGRLASFTELVATAIANADSRAELARLAEEQAALRRVATLVAAGAPPEEAFAAVAEEAGKLFLVDVANMCRYEPDGTATIVASAGGLFAVGSRLKLEGENGSTLVYQTGRAARIESYTDASGPLGTGARERGVRSGIGTPIMVEGRLWGALGIGTSTEQPLPPDAEARLASFTELVATAIANAESRAALTRLAEEQAALRRVATLVARGVPPTEIFSAVSEEVTRLFRAQAAVLRFTRDGPAVVFVGVSKTLDLPVGTRWEFQPGMASAEVYRTRCSARVDAMDWWSASGPVAGAARRMGIVSTIASPIVAEGRLWGAMSVASTDEVLPFGMEGRLEKFTELLATAIANAESRSELAASRGGSSPRRTRPAAGSSAICTTVRSSDWSRSDWRRAPRRPMFLPTGATCGLSCPTLRRDWLTRWRNCRSSRAESTRRSFPRVVLARLCVRSPAVRRYQSTLMSRRMRGFPSRSRSRRTTSRPRRWPTR